MEKILTAFCFTDIHNQQSMLDYPTTLRKSLIQAKELAMQEFGLADLAIVGGDNISDYPHWGRSCALPKKTSSISKPKCMLAFRRVLGTARFYTLPATTI